MALFEVGSPVTEDEFINRKEELRLLSRYIKEQQNVMIKAPRRFGKTSLIKQTLTHTNVPAIFIDLKRSPNITYLAEKLLDEGHKIVGINNFITQIKDGITKFLKQVKASVSVKIYEVVEISVEKIETEKDPEELFLYALDTLEHLAHKSSKKIILVLDEFQDIVNLGTTQILDKTRSVIQHHKHVTYIFAGSHESLMTKIFQNKSSPFFHFCRFIHLEGLELNDLCDYVIQKFKLRSIKVNLDELEALLTKLDGHPYYSMKTLQILYYYCLENNIKIIDKKSLEYSLNKAIFETRSYLDDVISRLKTKKHYYEVLYNLANGIKNNLHSVVLFKTYSALDEIGLVVHIERGVYKITDVFLKLYITEIN